MHTNKQQDVGSKLQGNSIIEKSGQILHGNSVTGLGPHDQNSNTFKSGKGGCNIHGMWVSQVAGAGVEFLPTMEHGRVDIRTKIFDLPNMKGGILSSHWTGHGMMSHESPTTMTIVFQEHLDQVLLLPYR